MYKRVDVAEQIDGFEYRNKDGFLEFVVLDEGGVDVQESNNGGNVYIYNEDIPKLIKALQAAYDYKQGV